MKLNDYETISLAGLLHDVGKIRQRSEEKIENDYNWSYCPEYKNHPSHIHAAHTAEFLDWFVNRFKIESENNLVNVASYHHKSGTDDPFVEIIKKADRLSSGFEREFSEKSENYKESKLISIFSEVGFSSNAEEYHYPIKKLGFDVIPTKDGVPKNESVEEYKALWKGFVADVGKISINLSFDAFYDAVQNVYEMYAWCVPSSSFKTYPDISLFDHSKTTAAIAQALYEFHKHNESLSPHKISQPQEDNFLLIQGDFSGIQNFIFSKMGESNKFAAKILRAKSFFVSLATDLAAYDICRKMGLTKAAIIMNAGGKFTLLTPNTQSSIDILEETKDVINDEIFKQSYGEVQFVIGYTKASDSDFQMGRFSKKIEELALILEESKLKPNIKQFVFDDYLENVKDNGICEICGKSPADAAAEDVPICKHCRSFKEIGEKLVKSEFFSIRTSGGIYIIDGLYADFRKYENSLLCFDLKTDREFRGFSKNRISSYVSIIKENEIEERYKNIKDSEDISINSIKPFSCIAEDVKYYNSPEHKGSAFLGILKADVDSLGKLFVHGFRGKETISKIASLSRMVDFFFTGWLQHILREKYQSVYTVFSGGDDLFLIGPFNQIIDLSIDINNHLKEYVKNTDIHISAGIYMAKSKIPVYQMAESAEEILKEAKNSGRNRIGIFGRVLEWDLFQEMMKIDLESYFRDKVSDSYRYNLLKFADMAEKAKKGDNVRDLMWKPLFVYQTYRNVGSGAEKQERKEIIRNFLNQFVDYFERYRGDFIVPLSNYIYRRRG